MTQIQLATEFPFTLPRGITDNAGNIHRQGSMRLATARDEIQVQNDIRIKQNPSYSVLIYLARSITSLGSLPAVQPELLEELSVLDLAYLREFYNRINQHQQATMDVECPHCRHHLAVELDLASKS